MGRSLLYAIYNHKAGEEAQGEGKGKVSANLSQNIAYERAPSLFDAVEVTKRDSIVRLQQKDVELCIDGDRKGKPVFLSNIQQRIILALSYGLSIEMDTHEDVRRKVMDPFTGSVTREINVAGLARFIFGSNKEIYRKQIIREIFRIDRIWQVQRFTYNKKDGGGTVTRIKPLLRLEGVTRWDGPEPESKDMDTLEVKFGEIFFFDLNRRYAVLTPKVFEVWKKGGRGTELFAVLLNSLFSVYWQFKSAAECAERRVRKENKPNAAGLEKLIREERQKAMMYELNVSTIKSKVTRDYDSNTQNRKYFWTDFDNAAKGFIELGIVERVNKVKGARDQGKVIFVLSESYGQTGKPEAETPLLEDLKE